MKYIAWIITLILFVRLLQKDKLLRKVAMSSDRQCQLTRKYMMLYLKEKGINHRLGFKEF